MTLVETEPGTFRLLKRYKRVKEDLIVRKLNYAALKENKVMSVPA